MEQTGDALLLCPAPVLLLNLPCSLVTAAGAGLGLKWPHEDSVITSVTQLWDKGSSPSHLAPPGAALHQA